MRLVGFHGIVGVGESVLGHTLYSNVICESSAKAMSCTSMLYCVRFLPLRVKLQGLRLASLVALFPPSLIYPRLPQILRV